jgi:hypothetical protein
LRQLAAGLLSLRRLGIDALVEDRRTMMPETIGLTRMIALDPRNGMRDR